MTSPAETVGIELAGIVADRLEAGMVLKFGHRDYCGIGLRYAEGEYICGEVNDGHLPSRSELEGYWQEGGGIERMTWSSKSYFVAWLFSQSDESMSGSELINKWLRNNQPY